MDKTNSSGSSKADKSRTYLINGDFIKFHSVFKDCSEIIEEYNLYSEEIVSRRVKKLKITGKEEWTLEIGDPQSSLKKEDDFLIKENANNPILIRKDTSKDFGFRVRNLSGDKSNFIVECDKTKDDIVIKTLNKKYYKRFDIPDMKRLGLNLDQNYIKVNFMNNTLIISYLKPTEVLKEEEEIIAEMKKIKREIKENPQAKYDPGCKNQ